MGLDSAFIVDQSKRHVPNVNLVEAYPMRSAHTIHKRIMAMLPDKGMRWELQPGIVAFDSDGHESYWSHYYLLTPADMESLFGTVCVEVDTEVFNIDNDEDERIRLRALVILLDLYYPGCGDLIMYAWSE